MVAMNNFCLLYRMQIVKRREKKLCHCVFITLVHNLWICYSFCRCVSAFLFALRPIFIIVLDVYAVSLLFLRQRFSSLMHDPLLNSLECVCNISLMPRIFRSGYTIFFLL